MNVFELLKQDHRKVEQLFSQLENARGQQRQALFEQLRDNLIAHAHAEEKAFYPRFRDEKQTHEKIEDGIQEHHEVEDMLHQMEGLSVDDPSWSEHCSKLKQAVQHHVQEEENEVFPKAMKLANSDEIKRMGSEVENIEQQELQARH